MTKKTILVTGGGGYIGSATTSLLHRRGYVCVGVDFRDPSEGVKNLYHEFYIIDIKNLRAISAIIKKHNPQVIIHLAATTQAGRGNVSPITYFKNNVLGGIAVLEAAKNNNCTKIVFASSAAVYQDSCLPLTEKSKIGPINPYGLSKSIFESLLSKYCRLYDMRCVVLRYFNVAGISKNYPIKKNVCADKTLIGTIASVVLGKRLFVPLFGARLPTKDGFAIRTYVHVDDVAQINYLATKYLLNHHKCKTYIVAGTPPYSNFEVLKVAERLCNKTIRYRIKEAQNEIVSSVADNSKAMRELKWKPKHVSIDTILSSVFDSYQINAQNNHI